MRRKRKRRKEDEEVNKNCSAGGGEEELFPAMNDFPPAYFKFCCTMLSSHATSSTVNTLYVFSSSSSDNLFEARGEGKPAAAVAEAAAAADAFIAATGVWLPNIS